MTEKKEQVVPGTLSVATDVIADLAGYAALESYGVVGMAAPTLQDGIAKMLPARRLRRGILVHNGETGISVELFVVIEHGTNLSTVSDNLADRVDSYSRLCRDTTRHLCSAVSCAKNNDSFCWNGSSTDRPSS